MKYLSLVIWLFAAGCSGGITPVEPADCTPNCADRVCGTDGCGAVCGLCDADLFCSRDGTCNTYCIPDCSFRVCGNDGCGGTCGICTSSTSTSGPCSEQGRCI